ncbi:MAG: energy-coupled thiamine transporter ThiT, partial [Bacilli bacterium]|nr:energy-coupled thiamine transporter ThiT [Bacilli bacterium]
MENEQKDRLSVIEFTQKYGHLIIAALAFIAFGFFFAPILKVVLVDGGSQNISLYHIANGSYKHSWSMYLTVSFLLLGIVFVLLKNVNKTFSSLGTLLLIMAIVMLSLEKKIFELDSMFEDVDFAWGFIVSVACLTLSAFLSLSLFYSVDKMTVRDIAEEGMLIALAFVLNLVKLFPAPTGGSVNLQMLPLFILAMRHGPTHGLIAGGIIYGLITVATDGYGFACYPFDYLIGFGSVAIVGAFKPLIFNRFYEEGRPGKGYILSESMIAVSTILATAVRFFGSTASSVIVWDYSFQAAALYNSMYIPISGGIAAIIIMASFKFIRMFNDRFP